MSRLALVLLASVVAIGASSCGGGDDGATSAPSTPAAPPEAVRDHRQAPPDRHARPDRRRNRPDRPRPSHRESTRQAVHKAVHASKPARLDPAQRRAAGVIRAYVAALNSHDGKRVCSLFAPGALAQVKLPRDRGDCAASVSASIGYRDPRGFPVYESSRVPRIRSVTIDGSDARVVATVVTRFAKGREPSIEDDLVYLRGDGGEWLLAKPSATFYRAIGAGDIPPSVLAPP